MGTTKKKLAAKKPAAKKTSTKKPAAKKAAKPAAAKAKGRKLRANENPHPRKLKGALYLEFKAAALQCQLHQEKLLAMNTKLDAFSMDEKYAPVFTLLRLRDSIASDIRDSKADFINVQKKVATKFAIPVEKLHEYTFDTDTGALTPSPIT